MRGGVRVLQKLLHCARRRILPNAHVFKVSFAFLAPAQNLAFLAPAQNLADCDRDRQTGSPVKFKFAFVDSNTTSTSSQPTAELSNPNAFSGGKDC